ncbi:MAG: type I restriction enzyme HsdR N-terminal domain-containing protein [Candidatus Azobacteroides sp.]|nr:type I restriction enzyme HsdR N-terminal domain-containing protein [Candidatus Azobacteroides sp.]
MEHLNLPVAELRIKKQNGKDYVFDHLRKQFVRLTPEEFVRQQFISFLIEYKGYPSGRMANEVEITLGNVKKRCDTVLYDDFLHPMMIIEYKSPSTVINQKTFDQITFYNFALHVSWLIVSNGIQHFCCRIDQEKKEYVFVNEIPEYKKLRVES